MADNFDNYGMKVQATASVKMPTASEIDKQIRNLEKSISKLQISGKLDDSSLKNLSHQLDTLKATVTTANFSPTALTELTNQVNRALQNINIGNINVGGVGNQAQQVGQQIGNNIAQGVASGVGKATTTVKSFSALMDSMKSQKVELNTEGLIDDKKTLDAIKQTYSEFGQVKITNKVFDAGQLQSFKVNIEQVNGELKETRTFMMQLSDNGKFFVFPDDTIKGTEKYVQHLNAAKNATNATGEALNAQNQRLAEQAKYYGKIKEETNHLYSLKQKLLSADELQTAELNKQIKSTKQRITYNNQQLNKKGLRDNSLEREINDLVVAREKQLALSDAKAQDTANTKAQAQAQREANAVLKEQQALQEQVNKIQLLSNGGIKNDYATQIAKLEGDFRSLGLAQDTIATKTQNVKNSLATLRAEFAKPVDQQNFQAIQTANDNLQRELVESRNEFEQLRASMKGMATEQQRLSLANTIEAWNQKNTAATKAVREENERYVLSLRDLSNQMTRIDFNKINTGFKQNENSMRTLHKLGASLKDQLKQAASSFTQWVSVSSAIMAVIYQLQKMPQKVKELDDAITDFTMATGANKAQISELTKVYSKLGDELSATVTDVTISATEWLKQGKSIAETETLIRDAMVLSKVGKLSSEESTKYLTSAMKGYNVTAEETLAIVDKLSAVDMASATDVGGLAEGMSEVANNANLAGISMDKLLGYLATIGEVTQSSMSEVGTSLNAIFSRMGNIKLSRLKDYQNNGEDLSNVETVLRGEGIALRDSADDFRNFGEVLDEVAGRWNSFSEVSQRAIASAFAGTNHMEDFLVLMSNYDTALGYTETSLNSSGQAMEKFEAYEESLTGKLEKLENAFIKLSNTVLDSGLLKGLVDLGTTGVKAIDGLVNALTPLGTIGLLGGAGLGIKNAG